MQLYVIQRRNGFRDAADLEAAAARSTAEGDKPGLRRPLDPLLRRRRRTSGELGTFCIYEGESPEAIRAHAAASVHGGRRGRAGARHRRRAPRPGRGDGVIRRALAAACSPSPPRGAGAGRAATSRARRDGRLPPRPPRLLAADRRRRHRLHRQARRGRHGRALRQRRARRRRQGVRRPRPSCVVYEPLANGGQRLVAAEYVVFQAAWDAKHDEAPELFGREFELVAGRQPLRPAAVLRAPRLAVEAQPGRHVRRLEPARHLRARLTPPPRLDHGLSLTGRSPAG